jgi:23S rRNA (adenine2030-N6)-methyltransferase
MLSYRHGYHAGNFADVLKHSVLVAILQYLKKKDTPFYFHDTHAGAGTYRILHGYMQKNREYLTGIDRLWQARPKSTLVQDYLEVIRSLNPPGKLNNYPGSPAIATRMLRPIDRAFLGERHSTDFRILSDHYNDRKNVQCEMIDAWQGLKSRLPPKERRGLILIDPSYELEADYRETSRALEEALQRFAQGIYAIWYPVLDEYTTEKFLNRFTRLSAKEILHVRLDTGTEGAGMHGCGLIILNPPYTLAGTLKSGLPELTTMLEVAPGKGRHRIELLEASR